MTAPTPDVQDISFRAEQVTSADWGLVPLHDVVRLAADDIPALVAALAAVTAERDDARQMLADAPHDEGCFEDSFDYGDGCRCWKAGL